MPTSTELIAGIRAVLTATGTGYATTGARDTHYAVWIFALIVDEAGAFGTPVLVATTPAGAARFRRNPSDLDDPPRYTYARLTGARRDWEAHVDVNVLGASGAPHGVDVSLFPAANGAVARARRAAPAMRSLGLGVEAKCFGTKDLSPNEGRVALGFLDEVGGTFWLVANKNNATVRMMLRMTRSRQTDFFPDARPGAAAETDLRLGARGQLSA